MNTNEALAKARNAIAEWHNEKPWNHDMKLLAADELIEAFEELDRLLTGGQAAPDDWADIDHKSPNMIVLESSTQLDQLRNALNNTGTHKLRVWIDGDCVKFKVNEHTWSPPMGRVQNPY